MLQHPHLQNNNNNTNNNLPGQTDSSSLPDQIFVHWGGTLLKRNLFSFIGVGLSFEEEFYFHSLKWGSLLKRNFIESTLKSKYKVHEFISSIP